LICVVLVVGIRNEETWGRTQVFFCFENRFQSLILCFVSSRSKFNFQSAFSTLKVFHQWQLRGSTPTIPQTFSSKKRSQFPHGQADGRGSEGSLLLKVNHFIWNFPRPKARDVSVGEAVEVCEKRKQHTVTKISDSSQRNRAIITRQQAQWMTASQSQASG
jgi:hypothetical protein